MSLRERKKQQSRQAILTAAHELIDSRGYEQAKMRDIAAAADISYQTLYNYFPTKALILQAILGTQLRNVATAIADLLQAYEGDLLHTLHEINRVRLAIIGQSGSGKSTLLNILGALDQPTSGLVSIQGVDISNPDSDALAHLRNDKIGFVFNPAFHVNKLTNDSTGGCKTTHSLVFCNLNDCTIIGRWNETTCFSFGPLPFYLVSK